MLSGQFPAASPTFYKSFVLSSRPGGHLKLSLSLSVPSPRVATRSLDKKFLCTLQISLRDFTGRAQELQQVPATRANGGIELQEKEAARRGEPPLRSAPGTLRFCKARRGAERAADGTLKRLPGERAQTHAVSFQKLAMAAAAAAGSYDLFGIKELNGKNYHAWSARIQAVLMQKELWGCIQNEPPSQDAENRQAWEQEDVATRSILLRSLSDELVLSVAGLNTAREIWNSLSDRHLKKTPMEQYSLKKRLCSMRVGENDSLDRHFEHIMEIVTDLKCSGDSIDESLVIAAIFASLPSRYRSIVQLLEMEENLSLDYVIARLTTRERLRCFSSECEDDLEESFTALKLHESDAVCFKCGRKGHFARECRGGADRSQTKTQSTYKERQRHFERNVSRVRKDKDLFLDANENKRLLELIYSDLLGPMATVTPSGNRYVLTFVEASTHFSHVYFLKNKSEVLENLKKYVAMLKNKFQRAPEAIRTDNGREYVNKEMKRFLEQEGISHELTTPYTPERNSVAERKNRKLTEMMRSMLLQANLPDKYWAEAFNTANYLLNRLPTEAIGKTPYEMWHGSKPSVSHLKVFGSKAYMYVPKHKRNKLDLRAEEGIFVGYAQGCKGYRILNPKTHTIKICSVIYIDEKSVLHNSKRVIPEEESEEEGSEEEYRETHAKRRNHRARIASLRTEGSYPSR